MDRSPLAQSILRDELFSQSEIWTKANRWERSSIWVSPGCMMGDAYRINLEEKETTMDLSNPDLKIFCKLSPAEQAALRALPREQVEYMMFNGQWEAKSFAEYSKTGVYRQKPQPPAPPKPKWVDVAPTQSPTGLWKVDASGNGNICLSTIPSHKDFLGFVYDKFVYPSLQFDIDKDENQKLIVPTAVRFRVS